ncbi:hypothetical protein RHS04_04813 [Rhizoctonia solani]|uniref:Uncharacterized protein n=1 Tax=Rhizoctonia solani TaxID=456999 RepID=A0A8H7H829_9AGAM|nr:hypothetical protein RHS04_04813 [Rhizoctonia solani]
MPPKRTKRVKIAPASVSESGFKNLPVLDHTFASSTTTASQGFLAIPNELVSQILSYYPEIKTIHILMNPTFIGNWKDAENYFVRFDVLRSLSQLCRLARDIYLPLLWERFQVCLTTNVEGQWFRSIGQTMERKSKGMLRNKHLWPYVKVVTVTLTRFQTSKVLPPFVKLLRALPNVHTLEIPHAHSAMTGALKQAFEGKTFPTIQRIILPTCAHEILRCCPEIREVTCNEDDGGRLIGALVQNGCKKLEVLRGVSPGPVLMKRFSAAGPPLRCISIANKYKEVIPMCGKFPSLRIIEIDYSEGVQIDVQSAKDSLRASAKYKPVKKGKKSRRESEDEDLSDSGLVDLYSDPRVIRLRKFLPRSPYYYNLSPEQFIPLEVKELPVEDSD